MSNDVKTVFKNIITKLNKEDYDRYNFSKRGKIIVYIIIVIVWFLLIRKCNKDESILNSKCKTVGTVVSSGNTVECEYSVDGKDYLSKTGSKGIPSNIEINNYDKFWVYYDCEDPSSSIIDYDERYMDTIPPADETK